MNIDHKKSQAWIDPNGLYLPTNFNRLDKGNIYTNEDLVKLKEERANINMQSNVVELDVETKLSEEKTFLAVPIMLNKTSNRGYEINHVTSIYGRTKSEEIDNVKKT